MDELQSAKPVRAKKSVPKSAPEPAALTDQDEGYTDSEEGENLADMPAKGGWCFKDYCPCEPHPDNDAGDRMYCDLMETGGNVDDRMLAIARARRAIRLALREASE